MAPKRDALRVRESDSDVEWVRPGPGPGFIPPASCQKVPNHFNGSLDELKHQTTTL